MFMKIGLVRLSAARWNQPQSIFLIEILKRWKFSCSVLLGTPLNPSEETQHQNLTGVNSQRNRVMDNALQHFNPTQIISMELLMEILPVAW